MFVVLQSFLFRPSPAAIERVHDVVSLTFEYMKCVDDADATVKKAHNFIDGELEKLTATQQRLASAKTIRTTITNVTERLQIADRQLAGLQSDISNANAGVCYLVVNFSNVNHDCVCVNCRWLDCDDGTG